MKRGGSSRGGDAMGRLAAAPEGHRSGFVAIVGRPNAGKSTLLNQILGEKIAIVTPKPQTTRRRLLGIHTEAAAQMLFVDTPGIHHAQGLMNERMVQQALAAIPDADVILWVVDSETGLDATQREIARLLPRDRAVVVAVNKIDLGAKERLLPILADLAVLMPECELIPISARSGEHVDVLLQALARRLPEGPRYYPGDEITDESERSLVAEIVREKIMLETQQEVPYAVAVTIDEFLERPRRRLIAIKATIHVERDSQKGILIGKSGQRLKAIGQAARIDTERLLGTKVYLELFVRVQPEWTRRAALLREFGL